MKNVNYSSRLLYVIFVISATIGFYSCDNDDNDNPPTALNNFTRALSTKYENPSINNRQEDGLLQMTLYDDNTLYYSITVHNMQSTDQLTGAYLCAGDVMTNGNIVLELTRTFNGTTASGTIPISQSLADSLKYSSNQIYVNIFSRQMGGGLLRGQVNTDIIYTSTVGLSGDNEVPKVTTSATGSAVVRMTKEGGEINSIVYFKVTADDLPAGDQLLTSGIYLGSATEVSPTSYIHLCESAQEFNLDQKRSISHTDASQLLRQPSYINVITQSYQGGIVRGQLTNDYVNPVVN